MTLAELKEPFASEDVEWRIGRAGEGDSGIWAMCLAYVTNRAIQDRLDEVCGPENWRNEFREAPAGGVLCGLSIRIGDEWVTKWDGAENTDMEAVKGGLSGAMKRAAVQWGVGRYLYHLPEGWAEIVQQGGNYGKTKDNKTFRWLPPALPPWALPGGKGRPGPDDKPGTLPPRSEPKNKRAPKSVDRATGELDAPTCPRCSGAVWDNRAKKASGQFSAKSPDYTCRDKDGCGWVLWLDSARDELTKRLGKLKENGVITEASAENCMEGVRDGALDSLRIAEDWIVGKEAEAA